MTVSGQFRADSYHIARVFASADRVFPAWNQQVDSFLADTSSIMSVNPAEKIAGLPHFSNAVDSTTVHPGGNGDRCKFRAQQSLRDAGASPSGSSKTENAWLRFADVASASAAPSVLPSLSSASEKCGPRMPASSDARSRRHRSSATMSARRESGSPGIDAFRKIGLSRRERISVVTMAQRAPAHSASRTPAVAQASACRCAIRSGSKSATSS